MSFFGQNLKKIRTYKKLSQKEFAELFNLSRPTVGAYEEGRAEPKLDKIIEIAKYFKITVDQLINSELTGQELAFTDIQLYPVVFVPYSAQRQYIDSTKQSIDFPAIKLFLPLKEVSIAFEIETNKIVFCKKSTEEATKNLLFVTDKGFIYKNFDKLKQNNILETWQIIYILDKPHSQNYDSEQLQTILEKLDLLLELNKKLN